MRNYWLFFSIALFTLSCQNSKKPISQETVKQQVDSVNVKQDSSDIYEHSIDYDNTKVIKTVYVVDRNGAAIRQHPDSESSILGSYEYGEELEVIELNNDWYGIRDRITREVEIDGRKAERTSWEKLYIEISKTSDFLSVNLIESDLYEASMLFEKKYVANEKVDSIVRNIITIELIEQSLFNSKKASKFEIIDKTDEIRKNKGVIELKCDTGVLKYVDNLSASENEQKFNYVGQVEFLNCYIISGTYWEWGDFIFVDRTSGKEVLKVSDYPLFSPNKNYIASFYTNPYDGSTEFELVSINENNLVHEYTISFNNWMVAIEKEKAFWSSDGFIYLPVTHSKSFWDNSGSLNSSFQYLKIKIH